MPIGWYICPYKKRSARRRYCAMDDYTAQIYAAEGKWTETEILGDRAIVKLRAPQAILNQADKVFKRIPKNRLDDSLSDLPAGVKTGLKNEMLDQGYTLAEIQAKFGDNLGSYTLKQILKFMATRRKKPRFDAQAGEIVFDGPDQACRDIESVDQEVE